MNKFKQTRRVNCAVTWKHHEHEADNMHVRASQVNNSALEECCPMHPRFMTRGCPAMHTAAWNGRPAHAGLLQLMVIHLSVYPSPQIATSTFCEPWPTYHGPVRYRSGVGKSGHRSKTDVHRISCRYFFSMAARETQLWPSG